MNKDLFTDSIAARLGLCVAAALMSANAAFAQSAGIEAGDVILGPPNAPFTDQNQVREWTMLSTVGHPRELLILRGTDQQRVTLTPGAYPRKWPKLPGPPKVGSVAPSLHLAEYRGAPPTELADGRKFILKPGMSYQVADRAEPHRSRTGSGAKLFIVD